MSPTPGFVIKSVTTESGFYTYPPKSGSSKSPQASGHSDQLPTTLQIPKGLKVFINIAWDANVPPPPPDASENAIRKAMMGEDIYVEDSKGKGDTVLGEGEYYLPVVVTEPRADVDKGVSIFVCYFVYFTFI